MSAAEKAASAHERFLRLAVVILGSDLAAQAYPASAAPDS